MANLLLPLATFSDAHYRRLWLGTSESDPSDGLIMENLIIGNRDIKSEVLVTGEFAETGYLSMWINFDKSENFDETELLLYDEIIMPLNDVVGNETVYTTVKSFGIGIPDHIAPGTYELRLELNSMPNGIGEVLDYLHMMVPIVPSIMVEEGGIYVHESDLRTKVVPPQSSLPSWLQWAMPWTVQSEEATHQPQALVNESGIATIPLILIITAIVASGSYLLAVLYNCIQTKRKSKCDKKAISLAGTFVDEDTAFGVQHVDSSSSSIE